MPRVTLLVAYLPGFVNFFGCEADIRRASFFCSGITLVIGLLPDLAPFLRGDAGGPAFGRRGLRRRTDVASDRHPAGASGRGNGRSKDSGPAEERRHEGHQR
jgi:hypothetical protein